MSYFYKSQSRILVILVLALNLVGCAKVTTIRHTADYENDLQRSRRVVILPPLVEVTQRGMGKPERMHNYEQQIEGYIQEELKPILEAKGYRVKIVTKREIHEAKISRNMSILQEAYIAQINKMYAQYQIVEKTAFELDAPLDGPFKNDKFFEEGDILAYPEYYFWSKTSAATAARFLAGVAFGPMARPSNPDDDFCELATLRVSLIDTARYNILWSNVDKEGTSAFGVMFGGKNEKAERNRLKRLYTLVLKPLPKK